MGLFPNLDSFFNTKTNQNIVKDLEEETLNRMASLFKTPTLFQTPEKPEETEEEEEE